MVSRALVACVQAGCLTQSLLDVLLPSPQHVAQDAGSGPTLGLIEVSRHVIEDATVVIFRYCMGQRPGLLPVSRIPRHGTEQKRKSCIDDIAGGARVSPDLAADLVHGLAAKLLLKKLE